MGAHWGEQDRALASPPGEKILKTCSSINITITLLLFLLPYI